MRELLCLKWNNHYSAFLKLLTNLHLKDLYSDATIACHGKYYPVHRLILSTCSDYFEEIFSQMKCKHPFIIVKDVCPKELEALLNYMYKGEVNVSQESLPGLLKAAEGLRIKGLAVPDGTLEDTESCDRQKKKSSHHSPQAKKRKINDLKDETENSFNEIIFDNRPTRSSNFTNESTSCFNSAYIKEEAAGLQDIDDHNVNSNIPKHHIEIKEECVEVETGILDSPTASELEKEQTNSSPEFSSIFSPEATMAPWMGSNIGGLLEEDTPLERRPLSLPNSPEMVNAQFPIHRKNSAMTTGDGLGKRYKCSYCSLAFNSTSARNMHHLYKHYTHKQLLSCNICAFQCFFNSQLEKHIRKHTGEKPFKCQFCPHRASQKGNLENHIRVCHFTEVDDSQNP